MLVHLIVGLALFPTGSVGCWSEGDRAETAHSPNVLLITIDTLRPDFLGVYGSSTRASPNLDELAHTGVVFERAIAASPRTAPSHASMMTSLWVRQHSIGWMNGSTRLDQESTLAQAFSDAGYNTAAFVGNMMLSTRMGLASGFDFYDDDLRNAEANRPNYRERNAKDTTQRALQWIERAHDGPWFLWVHYQDPHGPYMPPASHAQQFDLRQEGEERLPLLTKNRGERGIPAYQRLPNLEYPGEYASRYAGEIHFFDHWLGRLLARVDAGDSKAIVLLTADHGESFGEEGWWFSHGFRTTPDQIHVPFLLRAPGLEPERRSELVHHVDVAPTLLDLAGLPILPNARGLPLGRLLREQAAIPDRAVFADVGREASAYQGDRFIRADLEGESIDAQHYEWSSTREWKPVEPSEKLRLVLDQYVETTSQVMAAERVDVEVERERLKHLRALGYVEAGEAEELPVDAK